MKQDFKFIEQDNEDIAVKLLLDAMHLKYGYDFSGYSRAHIKRRVERRKVILGLNSILELIPLILEDKSVFEQLLLDFSINVTEMFRDPAFYKAFRQEVIPVLKTYPFIKIWHAGCSTGEEVYSMAILLKEEGLLERAQIYATDFNENVLIKAKEGIYSLDAIKEYSSNYQQSGGTASLSDYYLADYGSVIIDQALKKKVIFADHNLVTDGVFGEMHVVVCRNVLIYFGTELQNRVIQLFKDSLINGGFLCLGTKESLKYTSSADSFTPMVEEEKIYRKKFMFS